MLNRIELIDDDGADEYIFQKWNIADFYKKQIPAEDIALQIFPSGENERASLSAHRPNN